MIEGLDYNTSSIIINAFLNNKDFTDKMMREYLVVNDTSKMNDYRAFVSAYNAFKNNINPLPKEAIELIKKNANEYVNIISAINNKTNSQDYDTSTFDTSSYNISNLDTNESFNDISTDNSMQVNNNNQSVDTNTTNNNTQEKDIDYYDYNNGHVYSSTHAKEEIELQIKDLDKSINKFNEELHSSNEKRSKKDFYQLQEMIAKKENLEEQHKAINDLSKNYDNKLRTNFRDKRINYYQKKIEKKKGEISSSKYESNKEKMKEKLNKFKTKQGKIKEKQRKSINKRIIKGYNKALKSNKISNRAKALQEYKEYRDELINAKRNQSSINIINKVTNKIYDLRSMPLDMQINRLQKKQGNIKEKCKNNKANRLMQALTKQQGKHFAA